ncbi:metallophosphoesterase family protein [Paenibacillus aurantius]|uniref:Metallophosphoesterase family protein n=1 Tax=Paenibacillus aurantius TaxID=2918900 RepID=A0AA96LD19_9BACL|nr:metallophosphoesterase family protein [Paenibacillus aurantius]WNQ11421.1 metallophosphoesterase family protein [Paenibacillus aurantius]
MPKELKFREDRTFTIAQFTDLHWKDGGKEDQQTRRLMEEVLDAEKPDLVVFTGDVIYTGYVTPGHPVCEEPLQAFRDAVLPAEERGIPWAVVFGNHDTESGITRDELMAVVLKHPHTVTERGPEKLSGVGNYRLTIGSCGNGEAAAQLYFFDSGSYSPLDTVKGYDWIRSDQIDWYREQARQGMNPESPSLAFFHIPLPEFKQVWEQNPCYGHKYEEVCCPAVNSGLFAAMLETGGIGGIFCGHDHVNDYWGELHGIRLCYGRATGYNTYGREGFPRGARMIRLREGERSFDSWLRLAGGLVVHHQPEHTPGA